MISKKKVTALALAGLFVTPVLAATEVKYNEIRSGDGYLSVDASLFSQALQNSHNRTDSSKDAVELTMWGRHSNPRASEILCPWDNRSPPNGCIQ